MLLLPDYSYVPPAALPLQQLNDPRAGQAVADRLLGTDEPRPATMVRPAWGRPDDDDYVMPQSDRR